MSQTGTVISVAPQTVAAVGTNDGNNWIVLYAYQLDSGVGAQAQVVVGSGRNAAVALWASPTSTIQASAPGSSNPVLLPCPPLIQFAAFGIPTKGFPTA
jgi:hypothetical protein